MESCETVTPYEKGRYKETCGPCGAVFEVIVFGGRMAKASDEILQDYLCPECGQHYRCRGTTMSPRITLLTRRTDGG